ncbi:MAG: SCO6880 family protein [Acidimicrobiales bacterium]|jgi:hypothetical protein
MAEDRERFRFGPRDRRGLIAGARTGQIAVVAAGLVLSVVVLRTLTGPVRGPVALAIVLVAIGAVTWPVNGRTLDEWVPVVVRFVADAASGARRDAVAVHRRGEAHRAPAVFGSLEVLEVTTDAVGPIGAVHDARRQTLTALLALGGESFALLGEADRNRRIDGWASVLASVARDAGSVHRLQWIERTVPDPGEALLAYLEQAVATTGAFDPATFAAQRSYRELLTAECSGALAHELYFALTVRGPRRARTGEEPAAARLETEITLLDERCRRAGLEVLGVLTACGVTAALRRGFDIIPAARPADWPWPVAVASTWTALQTDGLWHATFWIAEWPRHEVGSDFLLPLLASSGDRRAVSVVMAPVPPLRAVRTAEHARTSGVADAELRRQHGFALTARVRREQEAVVRREHELADGHGAYRFSAYITVSAPGPGELDRACRRTEHAAALAGLDLRRLYGTQAEAFCCTLPVGRGCE